MDKKKGQICPVQKILKKKKKMSSDYKKYPLTINEVSSDFDFSSPYGRIIS